VGGIEGVPDSASSDGGSMWRGIALCIDDEGIRQLML
jgi:hypothetical protein